MINKFVCLVPMLFLGACSVINSEPNQRIDALDRRIGMVEEKVDALIDHNNRTVDILMDTELRLSELEKDARKRGVPTPIRGQDINTIGTPNYAKPTIVQRKLAQQQQQQKLKEQDAKQIEKPKAVGSLTGQDLTKAEETTQMAVKENVVEAPKNTPDTAKAEQVATKPAVNPVQAQLNQPSPEVEASKALYNKAYSLYTAKQYAEAEKLFDEYIQKYPSDVLAPNALYWKGETLYARALYPQAIFAFKEVQTRYPKHAKTADSLLKTAMSYSRLGDKENASLHFLVLVEDWPNSPAAQKARSLGVVQ